MSWNSFLTGDKKHEESLADFIKRTQVFTEHSFHVKKDIFENDMPSLEAVGFQGLPYSQKTHRNSGCCLSTE